MGHLLPVTSELEPTPADPLSLISLAAGIGALIFALFSMLPLFGLCLMPLSIISAALSLITGVGSLVRCGLNPQLGGRPQALAGLGLSLVWCVVAALMALFLLRAH